jgi:hypothetical protein
MIIVQCQKYWECWACGETWDEEPVFHKHDGMVWARYKEIKE